VQEGIVRKEQYLAVFNTSWEQLLQAAEMDMEAPVPSCPGWNARTLVGHMGGVFTFWNKWVRDRPRPADAAAITELHAEREAALPGYLTWREQGFTAAATPPGVVQFATRYQAELWARLAELPPQEPVWTFFPPDRTAGFVQRRIAHETTMHRWDAQAAQSIVEPFDDEIACDGIDEFLDAIIQVIYTSRNDQGTLPSYGGERYRFHRTDGAGEWLVEFVADGIRVQRASGPSDVSIGGSVSDLLLFLYGRIKADGLAVSGNVDLVQRWPELAGTF
jgi:uncharacterized protein (TIGR03083 family)